MNFDVITPKLLPELFRAMKKNTNFRFGAGYTDLLPELKHLNGNGLTVINLAQLQDKQFTGIIKQASALKIGALVTAGTLVEDQMVAKHFPVLHQASNQLASPQIRQVATLGGNLCTASPAGDIACALMALQSICEILSTNGISRLVPVYRFFTGHRQTVLTKNEVLSRVWVPFNKENTAIHSGFIKAGIRRSMECSVVSLAYHLQTNKEGQIIDAGIAAGSVAPVIQFAADAARFLTGKNITSITAKDKETFAQKVLQYANPVSDIRASAWYRREVLFNLSKSIFENQ